MFSNNFFCNLTTNKVIKERHWKSESSQLWWWNACRLRPCILNFKPNIQVGFRVGTSFSQFPNFRNFENRTILKLAKTKSTENSVFRRALMPTLKMAFSLIGSVIIILNNPFLHKANLMKNFSDWKQIVTHQHKWSSPRLNSFENWKPRFFSYENYNNLMTFLRKN